MMDWKYSFINKLSVKVNFYILVESKNVLSTMSYVKSAAV